MSANYQRIVVPEQLLGYEQQPQKDSERLQINESIVIKKR